MTPKSASTARPQRSWESGSFPQPIPLRSLSLFARQSPALKRNCLTGMKVGIPYDATAYIQDAIDEVLSTLTETLIIVIIVIFLFLGSIRSVLIPVIAIPISLVGAVFLMLVAGFTINLLTLLAIVLSVGLVVDDAIVMVENVERHIHLGKTPSAPLSTPPANWLVRSFR